MNNKTLLKFLEKNEFIGSDISIEISLMEYNQVSKIINDNIIICYYHDYYKKYDYTTINKYDLIDDIKNMDNSFFNFIGYIDKDIKLSLISILNNSIYEINYMIQAINQYNSSYMESCDFNYNSMQIIKKLSYLILESL